MKSDRAYKLYEISCQFDYMGDLYIRFHSSMQFHLCWFEVPRKKNEIWTTMDMLIHVNLFKMVFIIKKNIVNWMLISRGNCNFCIFGSAYGEIW